MKYVRIAPFRNSLCNIVLEAKSKDIPSLPATKYRDHENRLIYLTHYKLSVWERIKFLFEGVFQVHIMSPKMPPISVGFGNYFKSA